MNFLPWESKALRAIRRVRLFFFQQLVWKLAGVLKVHQSRKPVRDSNYIFPCLVVLLRAEINVGFKIREIVNNYFQKIIIFRVQS